jgi:RNA polymerase sigma factor (sigma-70 family)
VTAVALNHARSHLRRVRAERRARDRLTPLGSADEAKRSESLIDLRRALAALPRRQREVTVLRYYLDLDVADVATALGVSEGTAKTQLHRARRSLAAALGEPDVKEENNIAGN